MEAGDRVIYRPIDYRDMSADVGHRWWNAKATIVKIDTLNRAVIAFDDFPDCNYRARKNRFYANFEELEKAGD